ncbi:hypothetical protein [Phenylobacterium sp.]|jgi:hypothetical protein|uniref:hypothetical protein n=1 Tax=Phenylobacterium sp. TaxID=1871053 RepID=UPI002F413136
MVSTTPSSNGDRAALGRPCSHYRDKDQYEFDVVIEDRRGRTVIGRAGSRASMTLNVEVNARIEVQ